MPDHTSTIITVLVLIGIGTLCAWVIRAYRKLRIHRLLDSLSAILSRSPETLPLMTYRQALQYYVTDRPADTRIKNGAILLEGNEEGYLFTQVFLNARYELVLKPKGAPYGRKILVKELDDDLKKRFARKKTFDGKKVLFVSGVSRLLETASDVPIMTYADVLKYYSIQAPNIPEASKGAMLLKRGLRRHLFQQVFLNDRGDLLCAPGGKPYGRQCYVTDIDDYLKKLFGDRDVIILEESKTQDLHHSSAVKNAQESLAQQGAGRQEPFKETAPPCRPPIIRDADDALKRPRAEPRKESATPTPSPVAPSPTEQNGILTYKAALTYFVADRPSDARIKKGAIRLARHHKGYIVQQVFLDAHNEPVCGPKGKPLGRTLIVRDLDQELWETFDGKQLIIVE